MRFLFTTLQFEESAAYGRVGTALEGLGHEVRHVTFSRQAALDLRQAGAQAICLADRLRDAAPGDLDLQAQRIEREYPIPSLRDVWLTDPACKGMPERRCLERTVRHFLALEEIFAELEPDVVVPEVGSETMRTAAHLIAARRGATTLFLFYTIFPRPLRLYQDSYHRPIVAPEDVRALDDDERAEVEGFVRTYIDRDKPTLPHRRARITPAKLRDWVRHLRVQRSVDHDNDYLVPGRFVRNFVVQTARRRLSRRLYEPLPEDRKLVYFPLHVTDDFKVKRVIPHCVDQAYLIEQVADALPEGYELVLKEHPVSLGRNPVSFLRRLTRRDNVRMVDAYTSSHELIRRSEAIVVISSTVGLEALLHGKPVLTMGQPFYAGYGVTVDVDSFRELREQVPAVLRFSPDREQTLRFLHAAMRSTYEGAPAGVDASSANAQALARSMTAALERAPAH
ncbi:hypothetical protein OM076_31105 [Solirubrobacter ginsenosidimutans]|uniref:Capsular biosynthesis protein n=1 Tax=Solirubrobacter ginsenosidimutans TaxID=490573 RepID=A0A9X3S9A2_9ACTN|nr:hypothetical protein [Solirubrobacter ginsenosidimutans]MDA0164758.1 hypothetical protein [Solirubrobacter ginsenosidimutans]